MDFEDGFRYQIEFNWYFEIYDKIIQKNILIFEKTCIFLSYLSTKYSKISTLRTCGLTSEITSYCTNNYLNSSWEEVL